MNIVGRNLISVSMLLLIMVLGGGVSCPIFAAEGEESEINPSGFWPGDDENYSASVSPKGKGEYRLSITYRNGPIYDNFTATMETVAGVENAGVITNSRGKIIGAWLVSYLGTDKNGCKVYKLTIKLIPEKVRIPFAGTHTFTRHDCKNK